MTWFLEQSLLAEGHSLRPGPRQQTQRQSSVLPGPLRKNRVCAVSHFSSFFWLDRSSAGVKNPIKSQVARKGQFSVPRELADIARFAGGTWSGCVLSLFLAIPTRLQPTTCATSVRHIKRRRSRHIPVGGRTTVQSVVKPVLRAITSAAVARRPPSIPARRRSRRSLERAVRSTRCHWPGNGMGKKPSCRSREPSRAASENPQQGQVRGTGSATRRQIETSNSHLSVLSRAERCSSRSATASQLIPWHGIVKEVTVNRRVHAFQKFQTQI